MRIIIMIFVEFWWIQEIIIFNVIYVKDIYFWCKNLKTSKIIIFTLNVVKDNYFHRAVNSNDKTNLIIPIQEITRIKIDN